MKIVLCPKCQGSGNYGAVVDDLRMEWKPCPDCDGAGLETPVPQAPLALHIVWDGLLIGRFESDYILKAKPSADGYDVWVNGKKVTRGRKYVPANGRSLNRIIASLIQGSEAKKCIAAYVVNGAS